MQCLRCQAELQFAGAEQIQLGQMGWVVGSLPNLLSGALEVEVYVCPQCKKIELFSTADQTPEQQEELPQVVCPDCGRAHDFDYTKCPFCRHRY